MTYEYTDVHSQMRQHIRDTAAFYWGFNQLLEGDSGNNDEGYHFIARVFQTMLDNEGSPGMSDLAHYAVGHVAELFDKNLEHKAAWWRSVLLCRLLDAIGEADLNDEAIEALTAQVKGKAKAAEVDGSPVDDLSAAGAGSIEPL